MNLKKRVYIKSRLYRGGSTPPLKFYQNNRVTRKYMKRPFLNVKP